VGKLEKTAIVICSRPDSNRVPGKVFHKFNIGKKDITMLGALIYRLKKTNLPIILAIPKGTISQYCDYKDVLFFEGSYSDPLERMAEAARMYEVDNIIRVCHDKIFVDETLIQRALVIYNNLEVDYLFSSFFIDGTGFEIIRSSVLNLASSLYKDIEHISYAIKSVTKNVYNWAIPIHERSTMRMLADTIQDMQVLDFIFKRFKTKTLETPISKILDFLNIHPEISEINKPPEITIYTCCFNNEKYLKDCIESVITQKDFNVKNYEYILIDDASTDGSYDIMTYYASKYQNIKVIKNDKNLGLASSSNIALQKSSGRYIARIDADDYFASKTSVSELVNSIKHSDLEAIYPANFFGDKSVIQPAEENHHIGGAIFNKRSINDIKFTDGLRGYEGLDFFHRARNLLRIGYLANPIFFYRQHNESLTKENADKRKKIKEGIINGIRS